MNSARMSTLLRHSDAVVTYGILTAGVVHTSLTPVFKPKAGEDALWFAGSGLALGFLGALNLLRRTTNDSAMIRRCCRSANIVTTVYMALVARALPEPHVYTVLVLVGVATAHSLFTPSEPQSNAPHP